jgi:uncharacterized damage-inducible protein DinB
MDTIDRLLDHEDWATTTLLNVCRELSDEQLDRDFDIGHRSVRQTLGHMIFNFEFWNALMSGTPLEHHRQDQQTDWSVAALTELYEQDRTIFASTIRRKRDEGRLDDTFALHPRHSVSFGAIVIQICMHNELHREDVRHILQRLGIANPPELDHLLWEYVVTNG